MGNVLDALLARSGKTMADLPSNTSIGQMVRTKGVYDSKEFQRIRDMPYREWETDPGLEELCQYLTGLYKTPLGKMTLRPAQAIALAELAAYGGIFGPIPVGEGKTLITLLAALVVGAKRPILFLPAKLIEKTEREFKELSKHWKIPQNLRICSVELLGSPKTGPTLLETYLPDLIIGDEAHRFKNPKAARTKRLRRYVENYKTSCGFMSGTFLEDKLTDIYPMMSWSLRPEHLPLPRAWNELKWWGEAVDQQVTRRLAPGVLLELCRPGERQDLSGVRRALGRRISQTPGVIAVSAADAPCSLSIEADLFEGYSPKTDEVFRLLNKWETPDGWDIQDGIVRWQHCYQAALGFYYRWNPRPPREWMEARKEWYSRCRYITQHNHRELDSELQVTNAVDRGWFTKADKEALEDWRKIKGTFEPNQEAVWFDKSFLEHVAAWMEREKSPVWTMHVEFAKQLEALTGAPYFGAGGLTGDKKQSIETYPGGPCILSISANNEGRNLQDRYSKSYITAPMGTGKEWEQLLGRLHRLGQKADEVSFTVLMSCLAHFGCLTKAIDRSQMQKDTLTQNRKILLADRIIPDTTKVSGWRGPRWTPPETKTKKE